jgi:hypothetical protein
MHPDIAPLLAVTQALTAAGIESALGGSGLLHSLGLIAEVRDWDLTTEASLEQVQRALAAFPLDFPEHAGGRYATGYRIAICAGGVDIDLMGTFAVRTAAGVCHLPTLTCGMWQGVPVGSPEVWAVAYRLMERHPKADLLSEYLRARGARADAVRRLLAEPLPPGLRAEVAGWPDPPAPGPWWPGGDAI